MSLESLLIIGCIFGNSEACITSGQAYYKSVDWPKQIEQYVQQNQSLSQTLVILSVLHNKKVTVGITNNLATSLDLTRDSGYSELRWTYGF